VVYGRPCSKPHRANVRVELLPSADPTEVHRRHGTELESSLISERVAAGIKAAKARGRHLGRPPISPRIVTEIEALAASTNLRIRQTHRVASKVSHGVVGEITKRVRAGLSPALWTLFTRILTLTSDTKRDGG
jgi:hypothetical protein